MRSNFALQTKGEPSHFIDCKGQLGDGQKTRERYGKQGDSGDVLLIATF